MQEILAIITVRKGSSLKDKNIRLYKGKPLLVNCIEKAKQIFPRVIVISDSEKYAELAKKSGAEIFIDNEVGDLEDVTIRMRKYCEKVGFNGRLVLCQCTSPNILLESYQKTFEVSKNLLDNEILMSCIEVTQKPSAFFLQDNNGYLYTAIKGMPIVSKPRQLLEKVFYYNGGITSFHSSQLLKDSLFEDAKLIPLMITEQEILDIDTEDDLRR